MAFDQTIKDEAIQGSKRLYIDNIVFFAQKLAEVESQSKQRFKEYFDNSYGVGSSNEITEEDLNTYHFDVPALTSMITLFEQFNNFMGNAAVVTGDYAQINNKIK